MLTTLPSTRLVWEREILRYLVGIVGIGLYSTLLHCQLEGRRFAQDDLCKRRRELSTSFVARPQSGDSQCPLQYDFLSLAPQRVPWEYEARLGALSGIRKRYHFSIEPESSRGVSSHLVYTSKLEMTWNFLLPSRGKAYQTYMKYVSCHVHGGLKYHHSEPHSLPDLVSRNLSLKKQMTPSRRRIREDAEVKFNPDLPSLARHIYRQSPASST